MVAVNQKLMDRLKQEEVETTLHIIDNEISAEYKHTIAVNKVKFQLVPPHDHRCNIAEKAIQVFKDHFISVSCGTVISFPMCLW